MSDSEDAKAPMADYERELTELLRKIAKECESALGKLYDLTIGQVYGLAVKILSNTAEADEVTVDVFRQVWSKATDYSPSRGTPSAWLITLTRSRSIDKLRSNVRRSRFYDELPENLEGDHNSPEEKTETRQKRALIESALSELSPQQRESIELAYFHGLTQTEISEHMNQPLGTVKSWMRAGMMKLRDIIGSREMAEAGD
jgi:RNA polymerase sigma-70 factor (ECF subfamily)